MRSYVLLLGGLILATPAATAQAQVTLLGHYQLGEDDPGALVGGAGNATTTDIAGTPNNLTKNGAPTYAANIVVGVGSHSMNFTGASDFYSGSTFATGTDNFVMQGWIVADNAGANAVALINGNGGSSGMGLIIHDNAHAGTRTWQGLYGGVSFLDTLVPVVAGVPTHMAVVRDSGTTRVYVNGVVEFTSAAAPNVPSGTMRIGIVDGRVDQVQVGTFTAGTFNPTTDLNFLFSNSPSLNQLYTNGFEAGDAGKYTLSGNVAVSTTGPVTEGTQRATFNSGQQPHNGVVTSSVINGTAGLPTYLYFDYGNFSNGAINPQNLLVEVLDANTNGVIFSQTINDGLGANTVALYSPWFLSFVPTVGDIRLRFTDTGGISADSSDGYLDNIRVSQQMAPIPEPLSLTVWAMLGVVGCGVAARRWKRRN